MALIKDETDMKIICYELNEVPWTVVDNYIAKKPNSSLAKIVQNSCQLTTVTYDSGELTPFFTWPTLHRGVYNDVHKIYFINQEILTSYAPVWEILAQQNYKVGVFGSLHSWPIPDSQTYSFFVPHTFARDAQTLPKELEHFQALNLEQTQRDGGAVVAQVKIKKYVKHLGKLIASGLKFITALKLGQHLVAEKINPNYKSRRSIMQAPLAFDFYWKLLKTHHPDFSCFFSNHVAGMMHRYWKYAYPEDFSYDLNSKKDYFFAKNIEKAMDIADAQLKKFKNLCDRQGFTLLVVSSMGQEAIKRGIYEGELRLKDPDLFINKLGFSGRVRNVLSMQPYNAFVCDSIEEITSFKKATEQLQDEEGRCLFTYIIADKTINLKLTGYSKKVLRENKVYFNGAAVAPEDLGISIVHRDVGTGYHKPEGIAVFYGKNVQKNTSRKQIESVQILPTILDYYQVEKQAYMAPSVYHEVFIS
jgi:hypothetical protein